MNGTGYNEAQRRVPGSALGLRENFLEWMVPQRRRRLGGRRGQFRRSSLRTQFSGSGFPGAASDPTWYANPLFLTTLPGHHCPRGGLGPIGLWEAKRTSEPAVPAFFPADTGLVGSWGFPGQLSPLPSPAHPPCDRCIRWKGQRRGCHLGHQPSITSKGRPTAARQKSTPTDISPTSESVYC